MDLIFLYGPPAVGKLTVGRALAAATGLPLFHNHLIVNAVTAVFDFHSESMPKLRQAFWLATFEEAARVDRSLIFTFAPENTVRHAFIGETVSVVEKHGGRVRFVELTCPVAEQDRRVELESRRGVGKLASREVLRELRKNGYLDFGPMPAELTVDTLANTPEEAARQIANGLSLALARPA